ncbi:unnamed protein product [Medioppia subpectinata]|uniref:Uncharacterized protein n=1 Tax=Medioppia subpectinata TaxID=1979941 RepID=A0A7R9L199_9ACAR|nr:unnamed protein product [Medioppia subpectinata]CAG2112458.1 unnamed protein product [Medioppia subpectinata]
MKDKPLRELVPEMMMSSKVLVLYLVPAFLYCLYNNLSFINLSSYDPTTYYLLLQLRVVVTVFCSCFAGVYNEYLLKDVGSKVHLMVQNVFMYIDSIACNLALLVLSGEVSRLSELSQSITIISDPKIIAVMVNNALCGIITSFFLKNLNSILKTFAAALELVFTAILCFIIFDIKIDMFTVISIAIVSYATFLYSQNPVINATNDKQLDEDNQHNHIQYSLLNDNKTDDKNESIV